MPNMPQCRFTNTLSDLQDCYDNAENYDRGTLSKEELKAFIRLVKLCKRFADDYFDDVESR